MQSCSRRAAHQILTPFLRRPGQLRAISARVMKMKARTMDGPAPVAAVYAPQIPTMITDLAATALRDFPKKNNNWLIIR